MRIGIISINLYCRITNYGSVLQSYALQQYLKKAGYSSEIIDYAPKYSENVYNKRGKMRIVPHNKIFRGWRRGWKEKVNFILSTPTRLKKYRQFQRFINKYIIKSENRCSANCFSADNCDCYITGSDTIWNIRQTKVFEKGFFCDFDCMKNGIAYAPSFGEAVYTEEETKIFRRLMKNYSAVSVRERVNMDVFGDKSNTIPEVLDPTLLLKAEDYDKVAAAPNVKGKYIFVYELENNKAVLSAVKAFAKEKGLKVIESSGVFINRYRYANKMRGGAGIEEWLGLIKNAEYVVTNSFHGSVFSVIYKKNFFTHTRSVANVKIKRFCEKLGLSDRVINTDGDICIPTENIDYSDVYEKLNTYRAESESFLLNALKKAEALR